MENPGAASRVQAAGVAACSDGDGVLLIQRKRERHGVRGRGKRGRNEKEKGRRDESETEDDDPMDTEEASSVLIAALESFSKALVNFEIQFRELLMT
ncbi:hypothetical protein TRIUR3_32402 [Triticum urartu]|uniref:Uncharacterized protein n=1 Tax=Triticum urartu TaxID=4572 RepID=M8A404_TRIUA|nr:hypothetical protein TRIUR3_32402 [Triticum urartu]